MKKADVNEVKQDLQKLYDAGYRSLAIVLCHSYTFGRELVAGKLARSTGFTHVSNPCQLLPMIKWCLEACRQRPMSILCPS